MFLDDFLVRAALGGAGVAAAAGPMGCMALWRRMAYFGDASAHAALLGVALALALDTAFFPLVLASALTMALFVARASGRLHARDALLGVASHSALAVALVSVAFLPGRAIDLSAYLFGDILAIGRSDLLIIWGAAAGAAALLVWRWDALLLATLDPDMSAAEGGRAEREELILILALALLVAGAMKVVGALLITGLLILPPAAARTLTTSPEGMAFGATAIGVVSALGGLWASWRFDAPAGPAIICVAALFFSALSLLARFRTARREGSRPRS